MGLQKSKSFKTNFTFQIVNRIYHKAICKMKICQEINLNENYLRIFLYLKKKVYLMEVIRRKKNAYFWTLSKSGLDKSGGPPLILYNLGVTFV